MDREYIFLAKIKNTDEKAFGEDLLENGSYYELPSGKIVYYNY